MKTLEVKHEEIRPDVGCVYLSGRMDIPGVQEVELRFTVLTSTLKKPVIVDLSAVELITSIGLGMLIRNANVLKTQGLPMIILNPKPNVERVIRMAALSELLPIEATLEAALGHIKTS